MAHHVVPLKIYVSVFCALLVGTALTVGANFIHFGRFNLIIALLIAFTKATLVVLFFMHLIHSTRLTWVVIIGAILWVGVLFVLTFADFATRGWQIY